MGNEQTKKASEQANKVSDEKRVVLTKKEHSKLSTKDYKFLTQQTGEKSINSFEENEISLYFSSLTFKAWQKIK